MTKKIFTRLNVEEFLPEKGIAAARRAMLNAADGAIVFDHGAFAYLSRVSGRRMPTLMRKALLPSLLEHLSQPPASDVDYGPLANIEQYAAILGLAQFALNDPQDWVFVQIPTIKNKSPDIWGYLPRLRPLEH